jgi:hypothetical protein
MASTYKLVGYDRETELLAVDHRLPAASVERAKVIAGTAAQPDIVGDWPLSPDQARGIAEIAGVTLDFDRYDWFLEPYLPVEGDRATR